MRRQRGRLEGWWCLVFLLALLLGGSFSPIEVLDIAEASAEDCFADHWRLERTRHPAVSHCLRTTRGTPAFSRDDAALIPVIRRVAVFSSGPATPNIADPCPPEWPLPPADAPWFPSAPFGISDFRSNRCWRLLPAFGMTRAEGHGARVLPWPTRS